MESLHQRFESWIREQRNKIKVSWPHWKLPWFNEREQRKKLQEEYNRKKQQLQNLCSSVLADSVSDLQDILCSMVLSECVYKRPASEIVRVVNKFKADFGGQVVSLERVQPSLDHVPHRYLLAEAGDTLFASFIGTKQYKDVIADVNILQGAIFHEDFADFTEEDADQVDDQFKAGENMGKPLQAKPDLQKIKSKPAAHRGFLARAKGIPALELFRLAQKKNRKLVLCGHSLGGAVAVLATLAILRVVASSSSSKENEKVQVKCITFSQPPVGNAALRDYVIRKGWQHYFKTYCIPEDLVPRILSPAYFHHYSSQALQNAVDVGNGSSMEKSEDGADISRTVKPKENEGEQLVLGLGPVQNSFWRLSRLVPLEGVRKQLDRFKGKRNDSLVADPSLTSRIDEAEAAPQSLEIQEGSDGISLTLFSNTDKGTPDETKSNNTTGRSNTRSGESKRWRRVPSLPSYVPFGQLYLLGNSSVESLSVSEYSKLTSVRSVIAELRERFQSHSMKSYRSRFQKIYELCMGIDASPILGVEQLPHFPYLQQWLGLAVAGTVELGHIVEPPVVQTATSLVPLGWTGVPGDKNRQEPLKVDIIGSGLHLCTLVQAKVNGIWCSTMVESLPSTLKDSSNLSIHPGLQKMRVLIGAPLKQSPRQLIPIDSLVSGFPSDVDPFKLYMGSSEGESIRVESLSNFFIYCTSDFITVSKEVFVKTRRVRLIGLEGAGKTSLYNAILGQIKLTTAVNLDKVNPDPDPQEGITGGLCYSDSAGVNLQELNLEVGRFREELWMGLRDLSRKTDLVVLVHNLSHKIPRVHQSESQLQPALSLLLNEAMAVGIPWVLAITNKFSVSAHQQKSAINAVVQAYKASPSMTEVVNSCPYVAPISGGGSDPFQERSSAACEGGDSSRMVAAQRFILAPINLVRMPFQKKALVLPVEGVTSLCQLIHRVLLSHEENTFQELARERLVLEVAIEKLRAAAAGKGSKGKVSSKTAAAVGASLGAGLGIVLAIVMGAASALRKP